jgi:uncharacterized membrane protein
MFTRISALCIAAALSTLLGAQAVASPSYSARGLSWSDGLESNLSGINQLGQTIGTSYGGSGASVPASIIWNATGGSTRTNDEFLSWGTGLNDAGVATGYTLGHAGSYNYSTAMLGNQMIYADAGIRSTAYGINNHGVAVGSAAANATPGNAKFDMDKPDHATVWDGQTATDIHPVNGGTSYARSINDAGQIAGEVNGMVTRWDHGTVSYLGNGTAAGINSLGAVAGTSNGNVMVWDSLGTHNLGAGTAGAINTLGQVVGSANGRATLWSDGLVYDLNSFLDAATVSAGWLLYEATGINDAGYIAANGYNSLLGVRQGYLLSPGSLLAPVPEAQTWAMLLAGLCLVGMATRRRKIAAR